MSKKISEQAVDLVMEDYETIYPCKYPAWIMCGAFSERERDIARKGYDAGRKHFIEHELRKYLYMASEGEPRPADLGVKFKYTDDEIIKKAKMASEGEPRPADLGVKFKYTDDEIIKKAKED